MLFRSVSVAATDSGGAVAQLAMSVTVTDEAEPGRTINGTNGRDTLTGTSGPDVIHGRNGPDTILAGDGNDRVFGNNGADTLVGGRGDDRLAGGDGPDTFVFGPNFGNDVITDFDRNDVISFDHTIFDSFADVMAAAHREGHNTVITVDASNTLTLQEVLPSQLHANDFMFV